MQVVEIPFGEFLPEQPDYKNPGCLVADNCFPVSGGYGPFPDIVTTGDENTEVVRGAKHLFQNDGTTMLVGGSSTRLFTYVGSTLTATTGYTAIGDGNFWDFEQFNDYVIAVSENNNPQYLTDLDTDTSWSALTGSPPEAKAVGRVGTFLMLGNLSNLGLPSSIQWSAENDPTDWPTPGTSDARLKSSGRAALQPEYGAITSITGDRYPLIFQERAISRIEVVGPPTVFNIQPIEEARGALAPASVVTVGWMTFFLAHDGFWATDGNQTTPIGTKRVNEWFFETVSEADRFRTQGAIAWEQQSVIWNFYPSVNATGFRRQLIYSWAENRWSTASMVNDWIVDSKVAGVTLEDLDALFPSGIEAVTPNLDSPFWGARSRVLSVFAQDGSGNSELYTLNGTATEATFQTGEFEPKPGSKVAVNAVYPVVENADQNTTGGVVWRNAKGGAQTTSTLTTVNSSGFCPVRVDGRFMAAKVVIPASADWDDAQGVMVEFRPSGRR